MKRFLIFLLTLFSLSVGCLAQITHTSKGNVDANANAILTKAAQKFNNGAISMNVNMVAKDSQKKEVQRVSANVLYKKGKYRVIVGDQQVISDGTTVWQWNKTSNEVMVDKISSIGDDLMNPASLLNNYSKNFKAKFIRQEDNGLAIVDLTPKKTMSYYRIRLKIDSRTSLLKSLEVNNYDSSMMEYKVSNFKSGVASSESDFVFDPSKHKGVEVIDMR